MAELSLRFEWMDPGGARGPELRATWARLEVAVAGHVVTRVLDRQTRSVRDGLYLPLYPLAEWVATNWWRLLYEVRSSHLSRGNGYQARHCFTEASEGFAMPALCLEPRGESLRLSWADGELARAPLEFVSRGAEFLGRDSVRAELTRFVGAVVGRLNDEGVQETVLQEEWAAILNTDPAEEEFCRLTAALGIDPFEVPEDQAQRIIQAAEALPAVLREEFFSAADLDALVEEARALREAIEELDVPHESLEPLRQLRERFSASARAPGRSWLSIEVPPWNQGYTAAQALRAELGLDGSPLPSFRSIGRSLGIEGQVLEDEIRRTRHLVTVDGVVDFDPEQRPGFAVTAATEAARRFNFCRELFEYLTAEDTAPIIVTRSTTYRQQRNRAFAAELLLPSNALRARVPADVVTYQEVNQIADEFGVSWAVASHQLRNHHIAEIAPS
jgi:hypothetical protein